MEGVFSFLGCLVFPVFIIIFISLDSLNYAMNVTLPIRYSTRDTTKFGRICTGMALTCFLATWIPIFIMIIFAPEVGNYSMRGQSDSFWIMVLEFFTSIPYFVITWGGFMFFLFAMTILDNAKMVRRLGVEEYKAMRFRK